MTATFTQVCEALVTRFETISGLHGYAFPPDQIQVPAVVVTAGDGDFVIYDEAADADNLELVATLFVQKTQNRSAFEALQSYLLGATSLRAVLAADPDLGGLVGSCRIRTARNFGEFTYGEMKYPGCEFPIEVLL